MKGKKNTDIKPNTKILINQSGNKQSAIVIGPSRQGDQCIIVEADSDDFSHKVSVVNVNDVEIIMSEEPTEFEDKLISDLAAAIRTFGTYTASDKGVDNIMHLPDGYEFAAIGEDRLVALLERLHNEVECGKQMIAGIYNAMERNESLWPFMENVESRLSTGTIRWFG